MPILLLVGTSYVILELKSDLEVLLLNLIPINVH